MKAVVRAIIGCLLSSVIPVQVLAEVTQPPNILLIMTDDVGFGATSTFGGPIPTPVFDELANKGVRFNRFHTTAVCSPTRASLLTGRYPHNVNMGSLPNWPTNYPGYTGIIPNSAASVARLLKNGGYSTAMFGKSHITPEWELSAAGPFDRWPTGLGFDYFYGFLGADMNMFSPVVTENTVMLEPDSSDEDYHFEKDMADRARRWVTTQHALTPEKPFFMYFSTGTAHAPNHAPKSRVESFKGKFSEGWEAMRSETFARQKRLGVIPEDATLSTAPSDLPRWENLSEKQKELYQRYMEAYAASLNFADEQIGRVIRAIEEIGQLDNTLIVYIQGDNGASEEGRVHGRFYEQMGINGFPEDLEYSMKHQEAIGSEPSYPLIPAGWAWAMNAPFPLAKRFASHLGGTRNGVVVSWPKGIQQIGGVRSQFHHVADIAPTLLEVAGISPPSIVDGVEQQPLDGISMAYTFNDPEAAPQRTLQVFEVLENYGLYQEGWLLSSTPAFSFFQPKSVPQIPLNERGWELYHLDQDFSQTTDLASQEPEKLQQMATRFWQEAERNNILPIHNSFGGREGVPSLAAQKLSMSYQHTIEFVPEDAAPHLIGREFIIDATIELPRSGGRGVVVTQGGIYGGYALYFSEGGRVRFHYNALGDAQFSVASKGRLKRGVHHVKVHFKPDSAQRGSGGVLTLKVGKQTVSSRIERTLKTWISHTEGFNVGIDHGTPVTPDYSVAESEFNGSIVDVTFTIK